MLLLRTPHAARSSYNNFSVISLSLVLGIHAGCMGGAVEVVWLPAEGELVFAIDQQKKPSTALATNNLGCAPYPT